MTKIISVYASDNVYDLINAIGKKTKRSLSNTALMLIEQSLTSLKEQR